MPKHSQENSVFLQLPPLEVKNCFGGGGGDERRFHFFISWDLKIARAEQAARPLQSPLWLPFPFFSAAHSLADIIVLMMHKRVTAGQVQLLIVLQTHTHTHTNALTRCSGENLPISF